MTTDHAELAARLDAALIRWRGLMTTPAPHDDAHAEAVDDALGHAAALADAILALPAPTVADLPAVALAFAWRCAGGIPSAAEDPDLHRAAVRLLGAFRAAPAQAAADAA